MARKPRTFIELFAGAGLLSHAFISVGFRPLQAVERNVHACRSYGSNVGDHVECGDVREVDPVGQCDLIIAGPPCQGFSSLNRRRGDDERNTLTLEIVRWVDICLPSIVVVENVPPYLNSLVYQVYQRRMRRRGYQLSEGILDASRFGVPQSRKRAISIASRIGRAELPEGGLPIPTVKDAWKGLRRKVNKHGLHTSPIPSELALQRFRVVPEGGDRRDILSSAPDLAPPSWHRLRENANTGVWGRMRYDEPAPTIRTCFQNPSKGRYLHPTEDRVITIREAARLQTIPDDWIFFGERIHVTTQIGNGVPVNFGQALAQVCLEMFSS